MQEQTAGELPAFDDDIYEQQCEIASFWTGSRLVVLASLFLWGTFVFAYFYLRALNSSNDWRVGHQHPSTIIGTVSAICVLAGVLTHYVGARRLQWAARFDWIISSLGALILFGVAAGLSIWELTRLPFQPGSSGYTSVFLAWAPINIVYIVGTFYWLETLLARALAHPEAVLAESPDGQMVVPGFGAKVEGFIVFSGFMAVATIVFWLLTYVV